MGAQGIAGPVIAVTGTPGTGKTTACSRLAAWGHGVIALSVFRGDPRFDLGADAARSDTHILDEEAIGAHLSAHMGDMLADNAAREGPVFVEGHFAHTLVVADRVLILRCRPSVLRQRLTARGWSEAKIRENLEAEGMDLILQEALAMRDEAEREGRQVHVGEIDTTERSPEATAGLLLRLARVEPVNLEIGRLDWSDEVLEWY